MHLRDFKSGVSLSDTLEKMHMKKCQILNSFVRPADQREARWEADHDLCVMLCVILLSGASLSDTIAYMNRRSILNSDLLTNEKPEERQIMTYVSHWVIHMGRCITNHMKMYVPNSESPNQSDLLTNEKPDERQIMTYVSCYYHAFQGAMQVPLRVWMWFRVTPHDCGV